jgi:hypothetical protein
VAERAFNHVIQGSVSPRYGGTDIRTTFAILLFVLSHKCGTYLFGVHQTIRPENKF